MAGSAAATEVGCASAGGLLADGAGDGAEDAGGGEDAGAGEGSAATGAGSGAGSAADDGWLGGGAGCGCGWGCDCPGGVCPRPGFKIDPISMAPVSYDDIRCRRLGDESVDRLARHGWRGVYRLCIGLCGTTGIARVSAYI
ncbi:hypothetical protein SPHINGOAX6_30172 [Sphingomonas sp. AX6]|nr:hypothetical protein SPHINGOAX6_30172 [Sphingomonas sp. AX6]